MRYLIAIHKDEDSDYGVTVPDIPGCYSAGATYEEAIQNAKEAIECHLEAISLDLFADNEPLPAPLPIDYWMKHDDFKGAVFALVEINLNEQS